MRASAKGIVQTTDTLITAVEGGELQLMHHPTGTPATRAVDWVVLAIQQAPNDRLYFDCLAAGVPVHRVGDAVTPRRAHSAVVDGHRVGQAL